MLPDSLNSRDIQSAIQDFQNARQSAIFEDFIYTLAGKQTRLLPYDQIRNRLNALETANTQLKDVPIASIIGSVGRVGDFSRTFRPLKRHDELRWVRVRQALESMDGLPPVELYQIGEVYFVRDGHHRISVARQVGADHIQAYVTLVQSRVSLSPTDSPEDIVIKSEQAEFLTRTNADSTLPSVQLEVTEPGSYPELLEHIMVHQYYMGIEQDREVEMKEALVHWYETYYLPVIQSIRESDLMDHFSGYTETDLYLLLTRYQTQVSDTVGFEIDTLAAAQNLSRNPAAVDAPASDANTPEPEAGEWRRSRRRRAEDHLFGSLLVPITGTQKGWNALDTALLVAHHEKAVITGLHILNAGEDTRPAEITAMEEEFNQRCQQAGIEARFRVETGKVSTLICERARWRDMLVIKLNHAPPTNLLDRLSSGFRTIIRRCPVPILAVPVDSRLHLESAVLGFDGSPKGREALYLSAYLSLRWNTRLTVVSACKNQDDCGNILQEAQNYLQERGIQAAYIQSSLAPDDAILAVAKETGAGQIIMGSYGANPVSEVLLGSALDMILQQAPVPVLICK